MDTSNSIGSMGWSALTSLRTAEARKPIAPLSVEEQPSLASTTDNFELSGLNLETSPASLAPQATVAAAPAVEREAVPVSLRDEDLGSGLLGGASSRSNLSSVASLGLLAQLEEAVPVQALRAVDGPSQPNAFADLHLVGPSSAARFLANPNELYVGM